jgi:glyoxylase-like metal-dependent hydrolase (beta-lactamase superfamily II)
MPPEGRIPRDDSRKRRNEMCPPGTAIDLSMTKALHSAVFSYVDLNFLGRPAIIATAVLASPSGVALVDPGPSTTLPTLLGALRQRGIELRDVRQLLLTHIHLDHAGATGTLLRDNPAIDVFVHERGAPHVIDPSRLLSSAERLYGADMQRLWGEVVPVPADRIHVLKGGERIPSAGRELEVAYTPGHASHHVSFFDPVDRVAFVGDTAGIRRGAGTYVMPPTPPPDIDLDAWAASATRILQWDPEFLFLTHFGPFRGAREHFGQLTDRMCKWSERVRQLLADQSLSEQERETAFVEYALTDMRRVVGDEEARQYGRAGRLDYSWQGLARYWRKAGFS